VPSFKVPLVTRIGNKTLTWMTNMLFGQSLTDMETCYKIIRGDTPAASSSRPTVSTSNQITVACCASVTGLWSGP
jgi:hypothetical protein